MFVDQTEMHYSYEVNVINTDIKSATKQRSYENYTHTNMHITKHTRRLLDVYDLLMNISILSVIIIRFYYTLMRIHKAS
jgi:hypothetical protein